MLDLTTLSNLRGPIECSFHSHLKMSMTHWYVQDAFCRSCKPTEPDRRTLIIPRLILGSSPELESILEVFNVDMRHCCYFC